MYTSIFFHYIKNIYTGLVNPLHHQNSYQNIYTQFLLCVDSLFSQKQIKKSKENKSLWNSVPHLCANTWSRPIIVYGDDISIQSEGARRLTIMDL